jgi:hypothetical protein
MSDSILIMPSVMTDSIVITSMLSVMTDSTVITSMLSVMTDSTVITSMLSVMTDSTVITSMLSVMTDSIVIACMLSVMTDSIRPLGEGRSTATVYGDPAAVAVDREKCSAADREKKGPAAVELPSQWREPLWRAPP